MGLSICLAAAGVSIALGSSLTLAWTHSVEKTEWQEDWRATPNGLVLTEARVKGSGAGMEPPPDARLIDGLYRWKPTLPPLKQIELRRSDATADWRICLSGRCRAVGEIIETSADPVALRLCFN